MKCISLALGLFLLLLNPASVMADELWQEVAIAQRSISTQDHPARYFKADLYALKQTLSRAGQEGGAELDTRISLPLDTGEIKQFRLLETHVMAAGLAARYPQIKTYKLAGIDNPHFSGRLSMSPKGFSAMVSSPTETWYLDPDSESVFRSYRKSSLSPTKTFSCGVTTHDFSHPVSSTTLASRVASRVAGSMRVYRLALAATAEYTVMAGGTKTLALAEMVKTINRVNEIYQRDLGIQLVLVDNNDDVIFTGSSLSDPYPTVSSVSLSNLLLKNQTTLNSYIGASNYDIGHVFTSGFGGGIASVGIVCQNEKAQGATAIISSGLLGDPFDIDYVAHEIGHQFNAQHTFNGTENSCSGSNRNTDTAYEPGSGSSIMAYAGLCGVESLQNNSDAHFHAGSMQEINAFTTTGFGANCGSLQSINNNPSEPVITASSDYTIPAQTPFMLSVEATDADNDSLSYTWDQMDAGTATDSATFGKDLGDNALFRSYLPQAQEWRYFPRLDSLINQTGIIGETLPTSSRAMNFKITVRDGKGGQAQDQLTINTDSTSAFYITSDTTGSSVSNPTATRTLTWAVGGTTAAPVNCATVDISLLKLNAAKTTYCEEPLVSNTVNDGSQDLTLPDETIPVARFKVSCADNVFFALSKGDMAVTGNSSADVSCFSTVSDSLEHGSTQIDVDPNTNFPTTNSPTISNEGDSGSFSLFSLLGLLSLFGFKSWGQHRRFMSPDRNATSL